jgi:acetyl esterase/lipase
MEVYRIDSDEPRGAVLVCPGGGYAHRADHEGGVIAETFNRAGFNAFVVHYRIKPYIFPAPQEDVFRAVKIVRSRAAEWNIKPDKLAVLGFSAGGHLAASSGVLFDEVEACNGDAADAVSARPDALILCYPVISGGDFAHHGSFLNLLGEGATPQGKERFSLEKRVTSDTPPAFLWHTAEDPGVPVENSLLFASALSAYKIPFELHVFPFGRHGLGLAPENPEIAIWPELCSTWLRNQGF